MVPRQTVVAAVAPKDPRQVLLLALDQLGAVNTLTERLQQAIAELPTVVSVRGFACALRPG